MEGSEVIRLDKWCAEQIFDALQHAEASAARIHDSWLPTVVKVEVGRDYIAVGAVVLSPRHVLVATRNCSLIIYPDEVHLHNHVAQTKHKGRYIFVDQRLCYTGKELYSAGELYEKVKEIFKKIVNVAASIVNH